MSQVWRKAWATLGLGVSLALATWCLSDSWAEDRGAANPQVAPSHSHPYGLSLGEWSVLQWQWLFSFPVDLHPLLDEVGVEAGQSGKVWFLGGTFSALEIEPGVILGAADRAGTIPSGTALFFPLIDTECSTLEGNGDTEAELRDCAHFFASFIVPDSVFLRIDGHEIDTSSLRVESPAFIYGPLPDNNVLGAPAGATSLAVSDGYFAMVAPLAVGRHVIEFGGVVDLTPIEGPTFIQDIRYTIDVAPRGRHD